jgi:hypothetical protein
MYRQYRCMASGKGATTLGTVSDVEQSAVMRTHHVHQLCLSGTTAQRPKQGDGDFANGIPLGIFYIDTALNAVVVSDGSGAWRNPLTGALV